MVQAAWTFFCSDFCKRPYRQRRARIPGGSYVFLDERPRRVDCSRDNVQDRPEKMEFGSGPVPVAGAVALLGPSFLSTKTCTAL